jgi:hypothetical protein
VLSVLRPTDVRSIGFPTWLNLHLSFHFSFSTSCRASATARAHL